MTGITGRVELEKGKKDDNFLKTMIDAACMTFKLLYGKGLVLIGSRGH